MNMPKQILNALVALIALLFLLLAADILTIIRLEQLQEHHQTAPADSTVTRSE